MVTQAIASGAQLATTVTAAVQALKAVQGLRKEVETLRKNGMSSAASALERECNFNEKRIRNGLAKNLTNRAKARAASRKRSRNGNGRFS